MKKIIVTAIITAILVLSASLLFAKPTSLVGNSSLPVTAVDLIGTKVGTTTTGIEFTSTSTTASYFKVIGQDINLAMINLKATAASAATVNMNVFVSNDASCSTATTTANWFDAGANLLNNPATTTPNVGTTTITWSPTAPSQTKKIILTNLNNKCLRFDVAATSTALYAQLITKE